MVLRNAMIPVATSLGLVFAFLFGGTILVEDDLLARRDRVAACSLGVVQGHPRRAGDHAATAAVIALTALLVDLTYLVIDPRVRQRAAS